MAESKKELRYLVEDTKYDSESNTVRGYALKFNINSTDLGGFVEVIEGGALDGVIERSDIVAVFEHNSNNGILARSKYGNGTLELSVDSVGLAFKFELGKTQLSTDVRDYLDRGDIDGCSFCFSVGNEAWDMAATPAVRTITKIDQLYDISLVVRPAYPNTEVALRGMPKDIEPKKTNNQEHSNYIKNLFKS